MLPARWKPSAVRFQEPGRGHGDGSGSKLRCDSMVLRPFTLPPSLRALMSGWTRLICVGLEQKESAVSLLRSVVVSHLVSSSESEFTVPMAAADSAELNWFKGSSSSSSDGEEDSAYRAKREDPVRLMVLDDLQVQIICLMSLNWSMKVKKMNLKVSHRKKWPNFLCWFQKSSSVYWI